MKVIVMICKLLNILKSMVYLNILRQSEMAIRVYSVHRFSSTWGDYDNDGYLDILLTGAVIGGSKQIQISRIYHNNGDNSFTEQTDINLAGVFMSSVAWGDNDNDGYLDILLTGSTGDWQNITPVYKIYHNNGDNTFTEQTGIALAGDREGSAAWGDYDNDGNLDI